MPKRYSNFYLNSPAPAGFGVKRRRLKRTGEIRSKYTIEVRADPLVVAGSALGCGEALATAYLDGVAKRIKLAGSNQVARSTKMRRQRQGSKATTPYAQKRYHAPRKKLTREQKKENWILGYAKHKEQPKKNAWPDTPPRPNETGKFNHSGRLREGITVIRKGARFSESKNLAVWTIMAPMNRLNEDTFGPGFQAFLSEFNALVQPEMATTTAEYQEQWRLMATEIAQRLSNLIKEKRRYMQFEGVKMAGRWAVAILG